MMKTLFLVAAVLAAFFAAFVALKLVFSATKTFTVQKLVRCALVAALYTALCLALAPFSFGAVQIRIAEALCLLPIFGVEYIIAVTLGCFLSNLLASSVLDVVFGTIATLLACLLTYALRNKRTKGLPLLASVPPIVCNAVIIGAMITFFFMGDTPITISVLLFNMLTVGIGQCISCGVLGVGLVRIIEKNKMLHELFTKND